MQSVDERDQRFGLRVVAKRVVLAVHLTQPMELHDGQRAIGRMVVEAEGVGVAGAGMGTEVVRGKRAVHEIERLADDGDVLR